MSTTGDHKAPSKRTKSEKAAREQRQRANRIKWNNFRAGFGLAPLRAYMEGYFITVEEARMEAAQFVADGGMLLPVADEGEKMDIDEEDPEEDEDNDDSEEEEDAVEEEVSRKGKAGAGFDVAFHPKHPYRKASSKRPSSRASTAKPTTTKSAYIVPNDKSTPTSKSKDTSNSNTNSKPKSKPRKQTSLQPEEGELEYADIEVNATSGAALAEFLKTQPISYLVEMQKELLKNDPRTFNILSQAFNLISLGPEPHENPHVPQDIIYNPHKKNSGPYPTSIPLLPEENTDFFSSEREKATACVIKYDAKGRGVNAKDFIKNNIQGYLKTSAGTRNITTHSRILSSLQIATSRTAFFTKLHSDHDLSTQKVQEIYKNHFVTGYRLLPTIRSAFDVTIRDLKGPKSIFVNSSDWFLQTLEVVNSHPEFCLLYFEENTTTFLKMLKSAAEKADLLRRHSMLEARPKEEYADLMGEENDRIFDDLFVRVLERET